MTAYFLKLGTIGFGGPVALVGYMQRDLVERHQWIDDEEYKLGLALAQIMPGPLAAQLAMAIGYFAHGVLGATLVGLAFVLPSFLMVLGALGALRRVWRAVVDAGRLLRRLRRGHRHHRHRRRTSWPARSTAAIRSCGASSRVLFVVTAVAQAELAEFFLVAGILVLLVKAPPSWLRARLPFLGLSPFVPSLFRS